MCSHIKGLSLYTYILTIYAATVL